METPEQAGGGAPRPRALPPSSLLCPKLALQQQVHSVDFSRLGGLYLFIFKLKRSRFTVVCRSLPYSQVAPLYTYIHSFVNTLFHQGLSQETG